MPKMKTNSGAAKRFKVTKSGKFKHARSRRRHLLEAKSPKQSRRMRAKGIVHASDWYKVHQMMPYG